MCFSYKSGRVDTMRHFACCVFQLQSGRVDTMRHFACCVFQLQSGRVVQTFVLLFCDGLFNMMHNVFAFTVLALVTPLSYAVANATKRIVIIGGSIVILQNSVSPLNAVGMLIAVFGVLCYNKVDSVWEGGRGG